MSEPKSQHVSRLHFQALFLSVFYQLKKNFKSPLSLPHLAVYKIEYNNSTATRRTIEAGLLAK